jgi:hypothetical protein
LGLTHEDYQEIRRARSDARLGIQRYAGGRWPSLKKHHVKIEQAFWASAYLVTMLSDHWLAGLWDMFVAAFYIYAHFMHIKILPKEAVGERAPPWQFWKRVEIDWWRPNLAPSDWRPYTAVAAMNILGLFATATSQGTVRYFVAIGTFVLASFMHGVINHFIDQLQTSKEEEPEIKKLQAVQLLRQDPKAWVIFSDMMRISVRNKVYGREIVDLMITDAIRIANRVLESKGGLAYRIGQRADEVAMVLPGKYSAQEVEKILNKIQREIEKAYQNKWVCAVLPASAADPAISGQLKGHARVVATVPIAASANGHAEKRPVVLIRKSKGLDEQTALRRFFKKSGMSELACEVLPFEVPYLPAGATRSHAEIKEPKDRLEEGLKLADIVQGQGKEQYHLVSVVETMDQSQLGRTRQDVLAAIYKKNDFRKDLESLREQLTEEERTKDHPFVLEPEYLSYQRSDLVKIVRELVKKPSQNARFYLVRGPPDSFYIIVSVAGQWQVALVSPSFVTSDSALLADFKRLREASGRPAENGNGFGFQVINKHDRFGHGVGNVLIHLDCIRLFSELQEKMKDRKTPLSDPEWMNLLGTVRKNINSDIQDLQLGIKLGVSLISSSDMESTPFDERLVLDRIETLSAAVRTPAKVTRDAGITEGVTLKSYQQNKDPDFWKTIEQEVLLEEAYQRIRSLRELLEAHEKVDRISHRGQMLLESLRRNDGSIAQVMMPTRPVASGLYGGAVLFFTGLVLASYHSVLPHLLPASLVFIVLGATVLWFWWSYLYRFSHLNRTQQDQFLKHVRQAQIAILVATGVLIISMVLNGIGVFTTLILFEVVQHNVYQIKLFKDGSRWGGAFARGVKKLKSQTDFNRVDARFLEPRRFSRIISQFALSACFVIGAFMIQVFLREKMFDSQRIFQVSLCFAVASAGFFGKAVVDLAIFLKRPSNKQGPASPGAVSPPGISMEPTSGAASAPVSGAMQTTAPPSILVDEAIVYGMDWDRAAQKGKITADEARDIKEKLLAQYESQWQHLAVPVKVTNINQIQQTLQLQGDEQTRNTYVVISMKNWKKMSVLERAALKSKTKQVLPIAELRFNQQKGEWRVSLPLFDTSLSGATIKIQRDSASLELAKALEVFSHEEMIHKAA